MSTEDPPVALRNRLRVLVEKESIAVVMRDSRVGRDPITRVLAGLPVKAGTIALLEMYVGKT